MIAIVGYLGQDSETREVGENSVVEFSVAEQVYMGKDKEKATNWFRVSLWNKYGTALAPYLKKGQMVFVEGTLLGREYENKEGKKGFAMDIKNAQVRLVGGEGKKSSESGGEDDPF